MPSSSRVPLIKERLRDKPRQSNRSIAKDLGVSEAAVRRARLALEEKESIPIVTHTEGRDGRLHKRTALPEEARASNPPTRDSSPPTAEFDGLRFTRERFMNGTRQAAHPSSILGQLKSAFIRHPLAFLVGLPFGGFVPLAVWCLTHLERFDWWDWALVSGGAVFSSLTVIQWGERILLSRIKAVGFAVLVEGVMITAETSSLSLGALGLLIVINSVACATALARDDSQTA